MDKLTDILSSFFVSSPRQTKKQSKKNQDKETFTEIPTQQTTIAIQTSYSNDSEVSEIFSEIQYTLDKLNENKQKEKDQKSSIKEEQNEKITQHKSVKTESKSEKVSKLESESKPESKSKSESESKPESKSKSESESKPESKSKSESKSKKEKVLKSESEKETPLLELKRKSILSSLTSSEEKEREITSIEDDDNRSILSEIKNKQSNLKKYILRPTDFYKSNLLIVNDDIKDSIEILSDLLYKLGLMKDLSDIYDNNIHVITSSENKKEFTKMLLDNPYLYFTNFNVKQQLSRKRIRELDSLERRTIYIIDNKTLTKPLKQKDIQTLMTKNVHVIIIAGEEYNLNHIYNAMGVKRVLIHKLNKSKNMQKHFYKTVIKKICGSREHTDTFEAYSSLINDENLDIKYIILKGGEMRYN